MKNIDYVNNTYDLGGKLRLELKKFYVRKIF